MKFRLRHLLLGLVLFGALLIVSARRQPFEVAEHRRFDAQLDQLEKRDETLNLTVLKSRSSLTTDYDAIPALVGALRQAVSEAATMPSFVPAAGRPPFERKLAEFARALEVKEQLVEDFKTESAVLNNSLSYLPLADRELVESLLPDADGRLLEIPAGRLINRSLVYALEGDERDVPEIRRLRAQLGDWWDRHPSHPQAGPVAQLAAHVDSIVLRKPKIEAMTRQIVALPTGALAVNLSRLYAVELTAALHRTAVARGTLEAACVLLLGGLAYLIYALDAANRRLETRVAERTAALFKENTERRRVDAELRALFDFLPAMTVFKDTENRILRANQRVADSVGKTIAEIEGRSTEEIYPDEAAKFYADDLEVIRSATPKLGIVETFRNAEGEDFWIETSKVPVFDPAGKVIGVVAMAQDVTERRRADLALRESEERFSGAFENAPIGVALVSLEGRFFKVNRALCALLGYAEAELLARSFHDVTYPEDLAPDIENVRRMLAGEFHSFQREKRYIHACGHVIAILVSVSLVRDRAGQPHYFIAQIQDITDRKLAETELRWKTAFLEAQVNSTLDGVLVVDPAGRMALQNQRFVELLSIPPHIAAEIDDTNRLLWVKSRVKNPEQFFAKVAYLNARPTEKSRDEIELKDGLVLDRYSSPVLGADGTYYGRIWTFRDITERKHAEQELKTLHRQLLDTSRQAGMAEVATAVLHNVGNVLNSVNVSATVVADSLRKSKMASLTRVVAMLREHEEDLGGFFAADARAKQLPPFLAQLAAHWSRQQAAAIDELGHLQKNIEHIKDIVAMQQTHAKTSGVTETVQITDLLEDTLRMNAESLAHHHLRVVRDFAAVPPVTVERHKVLQILVNLVRNAKHACDAGGHPDKTLTLRVFNGDGTVKVAVADNGIGIPPENLTRIFNHGFTTKKDGHGFGLHSGALAAQEMGGALHVESPGAGEGATFTLELPLNLKGDQHKSL